MHLLKGREILIEVKPINSQISGDNLVLTWLRQKTSYIVDNIAAIQQYGTTNWDGTVYRVNKDGTFQTGYMSKIVDLLNEVNVKVTLSSGSGNVFGTEVIKTFNNLTLYSHQVNAIQSVLTNKIANLPFIRGVVNAATNAGKSIIIAGIISQLKDGYCLVLIHNKLVFDQLVELFEKTNFSIGKISASHMSFGKITVAMERTFFSRYKEHTVVQQFVSKCSAVIVDEVHRASSQDYQQILYNCPAFSRIGFSGTAFEGTQRQAEIIEGMFGGIITQITNEQMISENISSRVVVDVYPVEYSKWAAFGTYREKLRSLYSNLGRIAIIKHVLSTYPKNVLIVVDTVEYAKELQVYLSEFNVPLISGDCTPKERKELLANFEQGNYDALITTSVLQEGVNVKDIRTLIYAVVGTSSIKLKQFIGRALRKKLYDNACKVIEFADALEPFHEHHLARVEIYKNEKFELCKKTL